MVKYQTMKYRTEIEIALPRRKVIELFDDPDNLLKWQRGLKSFELLSGEAGREGAKSKLVYEMGKRRIEMVETILKRDLPHEFHGTYVAKGVWNEMKNFFIEAGERKTIWRTESEFRFNSFPMKIMAFFMPGAFKKQTLQTMKDFKAFAELETNSDA